MLDMKRIIKRIIMVIKSDSPSPSTKNKLKKMRNNKRKKTSKITLRYSIKHYIQYTFLKVYFL